MLSSLAPATDKPFRPRGPEAITRNLDEVLSLGGSLAHAMNRWGLKPSSAERACERAGRQDLANRVRVVAVAR